MSMEPNTTRINVDVTMQAERGQYKSMQQTLSFIACKVTAPNAPVLKDVSNTVSTGFVDLEWTYQHTVVDDCMSKEVPLQAVVFDVVVLNTNKSKV